jgi:hypothetical protein
MVILPLGRIWRSEKVGGIPDNFHGSSHVFRFKPVSGNGQLKVTPTHAGAVFIRSKKHLQWLQILVSSLPQPAVQFSDDLPISYMTDEFL